MFWKWNQKNKGRHKKWKHERERDNWKWDEKRKFPSRRTSADMPYLQRDVCKILHKKSGLSSIPFAKSGNMKLEACYNVLLAIHGFHNILDNTVAYLVKARTVEPEKQPLLGNGRTQQYGNCHDKRCHAYSRRYGAVGQARFLGDEFTQQKSCFLCGPCPWVIKEGQRR
jgi:hypothetical protein